MALRLTACPLTKKTVYVFIRDLGKEGFVRVLLGGFALELLEDGGQLVRDLLDAQLDQPEAGALVKDYDQQHAPDDADVYALALALVREGRELLLADELRHASCRRDVTSGERSQTGCV